MFRPAAVFLALMFAAALPRAAAAADPEQRSAAIRAAAAPMAADVDWSLRPVDVGQTESRAPAHTRGVLLPSLYVSLAGLNAFDAYTTGKGLQTGAGTEANGVMSGVARNPAA